MANSSVFPDGGVDQFVSVQEITSADRDNIATYQYLLQQPTLTSAQQQQLIDLTNSLDTKLINSVKWNHVTDSITNVESFFLNNVDGYINQKQTEFDAEIANFTYEGTFDSSKVYMKKNIVSYNGEGYICLNDGINGIYPTDTTNWALIARQGIQGVQGVKGDPGANLVNKGTYNSTANYMINDLVEYEGSVYYCTVDNTSSVLPSNTSNWQLFVAQGLTTILTNFRNSVTTTSSSSNISIGISEYNSNDDLLFVYQDGKILTLGTDYTLDANLTSIDAPSGSTFASGLTFDFIVLKNMQQALVRTDGTLIQDNTIGDNALKTDVKVGSLATLTTNNKKDVVSAINETQINVIKNNVSPNLVPNSGFESVTGTATVFSDALTSYSGTYTSGQTFGPWTVNSGSFSGGSSGITATANGSRTTAGNPLWKPIVSTDGTTKLALTAQSEFNVATTSTAQELRLEQDSQNYYALVWDSTNIYIRLYKNSTASPEVIVATAKTAGSTYTFDLSLTNDGVITATVYDGGGTGGTIVYSKSYTDSPSLSGGFLETVKCDSNDLVSNASVTAPFADRWTPLSDAGIASWALSTTPISGKYSASVGAEPTSVTHVASPHITANPSTQYTLSQYVNVQSGTPNAGVRVIERNGSNAVIKDSAIRSAVTSTSGAEKIEYTFTTQATTATVEIRAEVTAAGTVNFDNVQLELGSTATPYTPKTQYIQTPLVAPSFSGDGSNVTNVDAAKLGGQPAANYMRTDAGAGTQTVADAVTFNGDLAVSDAAHTTLGFGNGVATLYLTSNSSGVNGGYIEFEPSSGMPNQLNISGAGTANLDLLTFAATETTFAGTITAPSAKLDQIESTSGGRVLLYNGSSYVDPLKYQ